MKPVKNIFMCLVHENQDCIIDLIRNLQYLDPASEIILYNGGPNADLFRYFPFDRYGVKIHPNPKPLKWGWLHDFAIDCMAYAIDNFKFDLITVVDSDQLACGKNYTSFITKTFHDHSDLGMLGQVAHRITQDTEIHPAVTAYLEREQWEQFLEKFPNGKNAFLHWSFWPSTAFTFKAAVSLVNLFRNDKQLNELLNKTKIWASEEILLPTLTVALGYTIVENPCSHEFVKYRSKYTDTDIKKAIEEPTAFWIHPIDRKINDHNRAIVRNRFENYSDRQQNVSTISVFDIYQKIKLVEGWLGFAEMELLLNICSKKVADKEYPVIVEIGSYCGKATSAMALATQQINNKTTIIAIDDFSGRLGAEDTRIDQYPPSFEKFKNTLVDLGISDKISVIKETPYRVVLSNEIDILLIDGLHDYANAARDFYAHEKKLANDGLVLFHDYCPDFKGVVALVDELLLKGHYEVTNIAASLIALKRTTAPNLKSRLPLVSCIMPTYNRHEFISQAIDQFLQQDYPNKELIIIDDSEVPMADLIPQSPLIIYSYEDTRTDLGSKRNHACDKANGEIIVHLDDDDFYAPDWLKKQVSFLLKHDLDITGLSTPVFYNKMERTVWQYIYPEKEKPWVYGATLCYTKKIWEANRFPVLNCGEDNMFVWSDLIKKIRPHQEIASYLGNIHNSNTSPKIMHSRWQKLRGNAAIDVLAYHGLTNCKMEVY